MERAEQTFLPNAHGLGAEDASLIHPGSWCAMLALCILKLSLSVWPWSY